MMGSPYFANKELANEKPAPQEPLSATVGLGPHHTPSADPHAHLLPGFVPKTKSNYKLPKGSTRPNAAPPTVTQAPKGAEKGIRRYKPAFKGEKPVGQEVVPGKFKPSSGRGPMIPVTRPYYQTKVDKRSGIELAVDKQVTPLFESAPKLASPRLTVPATIAGTVLSELGGGPSLVRLAGDVKNHNAAAGVGEAAGFLPFGRLGKALKGAKEAEEAIKAAHATDEAAKVREALPALKIAQGKQKALQSAERTARVAKAQNHLENAALSPERRIALAKNELKGELPKINYKGLTELDPAAVTKMKADILDHPHLLPFQKIRAAGALDKAAAGETLQRNEIDLLQHIFGKQPGLLGPKPSALKNGILSALNIPRSLMASVDLSAPFRQGLVVATRHPALFAKNFAPMVKAFGSEKVYQAVLDDIRSRPSYSLMQAAKLNITDLGHAVGGREEQFGSDLAETLTGGKLSPVRASGRAYTGFLDKTRADVFDNLIQKAQSQGINVQDEKFLKDLGRYINSATGRGPLGDHLQGAAKGLNALFFSPRLLASRVDLIFSPLTYAKADPFVRKEALRSMFQLAGTASTLLALAAQIPGVKVVTDPRNPDWGKIKLGHTRIDIGGGFQQPLRLFAQVATGTAISSTTGKKLNLTAGGFGNPTRLDLITRFFEGKESPLVSVATDYLRNSNQIGQKFTWGNEAYSHLTPLLVQDVSDLYHDRKGGVNGIAAAFGGAAIGSVGFGLQTYGPKKTKASSPKPGSYFENGSSGGGSAYFGSGGGGGGSAYFGG